MIRVGAYYPEDFDVIRARNIHAIGNLGALQALIVPEHSRTGFHVERPVAAAGVVPLWPGVGQGWMILDEDLPNIIAIVRAMRRGMRDIAREGPFHRIQADVQRGFEKGYKLLRVLGFAHEGPLEAYGTEGDDYERFAFVNRDLIGE